jgi:Ca-activated chloride channel family protein
MTMIPPSIPPAQPSRRTLGSLLGMEPPQDDPDSGGGAPADRARRERKEPMRLPLAKVVAKVSIVGDCAQTELQEHYTNTHDRPLNVRHTIPLAHGAAVTGVEIRAGDRTVRGVCRRSAEARAEHASAKQRGKTTALIEQRRDDMHEISLGNVPAGASIVIALTIVERLRVADGRFEFRLPTAISPKYVPGTAIGHDGDGWSPDTHRAPDASHLTPPVLAGPAPMIDFDVTLAPGVTDIHSSIALSRTDAADGSVIMRPEGQVRCDGDIVIRYWSRETTPTLRAYSDGERTLVVVDPPLTRQPRLEKVREAVYVLDRSGSMRGSRIESAVRALKASLRSLSPRDRVQIIAFSDSLTKFRPRPTPATADTIEAAVRWLDRIEADGGTDALESLRLACTSKVASKRVRTVLLITDGDVANDQEILELTQSMDPAARLFTLGIGKAPSHGLLSRLARLGGGTCMSVEDGGDLEAEFPLLDAALAGPIAHGLRESTSEPGETESMGDLFSGRATSFFVDGHRDRVSVASIDGCYAGECAVQSAPMRLGALWARNEVERLEDRRVAKPDLADSIDAAIAELGVVHQIQTRLTSFVAVDEASQVIGEPIALVQPVAVPEDSVMLRYDRADFMGSVCYSPCPSPMHDVRYSIVEDAAEASADQRRRHRRLHGALPSTEQLGDVLALLGGTRGLPREFGSRETWIRCGLGLIVDAHDLASLRETSRTIGFPRQIAPEALYAEHMTLPHALVMMILAMAWDAVGWEDGMTGDPLHTESLEPSLEQWKHVVEVIEAHATHPGMVQFMLAAQSSDIPGMIRAVVQVVAKMSAARTEA